MVRYLRVCFFIIFLFLWLVCSSFAAERLSVAVIRASEATPFQEILNGFQDFFHENSQGIDVNNYLLKKGQANARDITKQIKDTESPIVLALGSSSLTTICPELGTESVIIGVALRSLDFECAREVGGVYLEYPLMIQLEWMNRILPRARNIGVIYSSDYNKQKIANVSRLATQMGLTILKREVSAPYQIPAALSYLSNHADVLWGISDNIVLTPETVKKMLLFSFRNKIPFVGLSKAWGKAGALYALDRDYYDIGRQCAEMAYEEIRGMGDVRLVPQSPRKITYYLNQKTARHLKIDFSSSLIKGAEETY